MEWPEKCEKWSSAAKNALHIVVVIIILIALFNAGSQAWLGKQLAFLASAGVESVKVGELEFKLKQAKEAAKTIANSPQTAAAAPSVPLPKPQDKNPAPNIVPALEVINEPGSFWVYVGQLQNNQFLHPPNFSRPRLAPPNAGDVLTAVIDTYKRSDPPVQIDGDWKLGQIIGVIPKTKQIRVEKVQTVEGGNIWVRAANAAQ